jgi:hypothetical protein
MRDNKSGAPTTVVALAANTVGEAFVSDCDRFRRDRRRLGTAVLGRRSMIVALTGDAAREAMMRTPAPASDRCRLVSPAKSGRSRDMPLRAVRFAIPVLALVLLAASAGAASAGSIRLDKATAAAVADDIVASDIFDDSQDLMRCIRVGRSRVDCIFEIGFDGPVEGVMVRAVRVSHRRLFSDVYSARVRSHQHYTKANSIRRSPPDFRLRPLHRDYRRLGLTYDANYLVGVRLGWGKPRLPELIRAQCSLQRRLRCKR